MINNPAAIQGCKSISVFFPAYNDEGSITAMVEKAFALLPRLTDDYEVIVVNDGSRDGTAAAIDDLERKYPQLRVIDHQRNQGYGGALRTGFAHAEKNWIFYTDGDGQYEVDELVRLVPLMVDGVDIVNGYKIKRFDGKHRVIIGGVYKVLARLLFNLPIRDVDCDFRLIKRQAIQDIELVSTSGMVCAEMVYKMSMAGCRFAETPVHHYPRRHGKSQFFTFSRVARTAFDFFGLWLKLVVCQRVGAGFIGNRKTLAKTSEGIEQFLLILAQSFIFTAFT